MALWVWGTALFAIGIILMVTGAIWWSVQKRENNNVAVNTWYTSLLTIGGLILSIIALILMLVTIFGITESSPTRYSNQPQYYIPGVNQYQLGPVQYVPANSVIS